MLNFTYKFSLFQQTYKSVSSSHVIAADLDARFSCNERRHEFMAVEHLPVTVICNIHPHARDEAINNFPNHSPDRKWL